MIELNRTLIKNTKTQWLTIMNNKLPQKLQDSPYHLVIVSPSVRAGLLSRFTLRIFSVKRCRKTRNLL